MKRSYQFNWYETKSTRYGKPPLARTNTVKLSTPTGDTKIDAKRALEIFMKQFGNLNKNTIISIKEFGENGQIGEDIVPTKKGIVPIARKKEKVVIESEK